MAQLDWFETWFGTPYYHLLYQNRNKEEANHFMAHLVQYLLPSQEAHILDLACGNGRHARSLAQYGFRVTGTDISAANIAHAQQFATPRLQFFIQDMRQVGFVNHFDVVLNLFTSFGYFEEKRDDQKVARCIAFALKKSGRFVLDYINTTKAITSLVAQEVVLRGALQFSLQRKVEAGFITKLIDLKDESGTTHHYRERVKCFTKQQLQALFEKEGLNLCATFGSYDLEPFDERESPRLILVFER